MAPTIKSLHSVYIWSEALKVWIWRMLKISRKDKATNVWVVEKVKEARSMLNTIWQRKHRQLGHVFRNEVLFWKIIEGRMKGRAFHGWRDHCAEWACVISKVSGSKKDNRFRMESYTQNRNAINLPQADYLNKKMHIQYQQSTFVLLRTAYNVAKDTYTQALHLESQWNALLVSWRAMPFGLWPWKVMDNSAEMLTQSQFDVCMPLNCAKFPKKWQVTKLVATKRWSRLCILYRTLRWYINTVLLLLASASLVLTPSTPAVPNCSVRRVQHHIGLISYF